MSNLTISKRNGDNYRTIWYMPGGGANWVNYMTWCYYNNTILTTLPAHFSHKIVSETLPNYIYLYWLQSHQANPNDADIVLGSTRHGINLKFNNITKNGRWFYNVEELKTFTSLRINYNLDWAKIVEDPEQFVIDLNQLSGYNIKFNSIVEQTFVQYLDTAYPHPLLRGDQYRNHPWITQIFEYIFQQLDSTESFTQSQKNDEVWNRIDSQWIKYYPSRWHS